jgi:DnaJ family protein C protein 28
MGKWEDLVEKKIREGIEQGLFDNLPGRGRPLELEENPFEDPSMRMAHRLLRNNGFSLPWIEERKEIEAAIDVLRAGLARSFAVYHETLKSRRQGEQAEADWRQNLTAFQRQVTDLNRRIASYNLKTPSAAFHRMPLDAPHEIQKITRDKSSE